MNNRDQQQRIAIIGSGISGLSAAWLLRDEAQVTLYEADNRFGGHTHTYQVDEADKKIPVDTGFMVFNERNYPNLVKLFRHLGVGSYETDMSFSLSLNQGAIEYAGGNLNTLFGQRRNLIKPVFWRMISDILRFNRHAWRAVHKGMDESQSLAEFLDTLNPGNAFRDHYLYPMAAAIWSCPRDQIQNFPAAQFLRFFANHGLINLTDRPQWYTVDRGSRHYLDHMLDDLGNMARKNSPVTSVVRHPSHVMVSTPDDTLAYDQVVMACHTDQALSILDKPTRDETNALSLIPYQANRVVLHKDDVLMPRRRRVWSSWNYLGDFTGADATPRVSVTYWMNSLQSLDTSQQYYVTLNPCTEPDEKLIIDEFQYDHPVFGQESLSAQQTIRSIQGLHRTWYCGAWLGYGFHEDGLSSGIAVAKQLGAGLPWDEQHDSHIPLSKDTSCNIQRAA